MITDATKNRILDLALALLAGRERRGHETPTVTVREIYERVDGVAMSDVSDTLVANFERVVVEETENGLKLRVAHFHMGDKPFTGYMGKKLPVKRGDTVTIPKGTQIRSTGRKTYAAGRTYKVKVHDVCPGVPTYDHQGETVPAQAPKIIWVGAGNYWCEADLNNIPEAKIDELEVVSDGVKFLVDTKADQVDIFRTILGGVASSSHAGSARIKSGKLVERDSSTLTGADWAAIEAAVCPKAPETPAGQGTLPL